MRFGLFAPFDAHPDQGLTSMRVYQQSLEQIRVAEALGFDSFWVTEHHFHPYGVCPQPAVWLAAAAQCTQRIGLGVAVSVLSLHHPLEVAEQYAMVDVLSHGRLLMAVGSGYLGHEFDGFGLSLEDKRERFDAALKMLLAAWRGEAVTGEAGPFRARKARLNVLPLQKPHPPLWVGISRPEAAPFVARQGLALMSVPYVRTGALERVRAMYAAYREAGAEAGHDVAAHELPVVLHVHVGETDASAWASAGPYLEHYLRTRVVEGAQWDGSIGQDVVLIGSPDTVAAGVAAYQDAGANHFVAMMAFGGLPQELVLASMARFSQRVRPVLGADARRRKT